MTKVFALLAAIVTSPTFAVTVSVQDICTDAKWIDADVSLAEGLSVGGATILAFDRERLTYLGTKAGISSIRETPIGTAAREILSETHMRAYGWCYEINGVAPDKMPDEIPLTSANDVIDWYFGFAEYKDGAWISYCTPTHLASPKFICP